MEVPRLDQSGKITHKKERVVLYWQDLAANICKEYDIKDPFKKMIFKMAKNQRQFLETKVGLMREMSQYQPDKYRQLKEAGKLGNYLFATFRKKD